MTESIRQESIPLGPLTETDNLETDDAVVIELGEALYLDLMRAPVSKEAVELSRLLAEQFQETSGRTNMRRGENYEEYVVSVGRFVAGILYASHVRSAGWCYRTLNSNDYKGEPVSYRTFSEIHKAALSLGLVEVHPGFFDRDDCWGPVLPGDTSRSIGQGRATRWRATDKLIALAQDHDIELNAINDHFPIPMPERCLVLNSASKRIGPKKLQGGAINYEDSPLSKKLEEEIRDLNWYLTDTDLKGGEFSGFRRIFNQGSRIGYSWDKGGRLYALPGRNSYQSLSKSERLKMRINGDFVIEIDVKSSYLTIVHGLLDITPPDTDLYEVSDIPRDVVKAWVTMTIGHNKLHSRWPKAIADGFLEKTGNKLQKAFPLKEVTETVGDKYPFFRDWEDLGIDCFQLMYIESNAILSTMLWLKDCWNIPSFPVHDSLIVPHDEARLGEYGLVSAYRDQCGIEASCELNSRDGKIPEFNDAYAIEYSPPEYWRKPTGRHD